MARTEAVSPEVGEVVVRMLAYEAVVQVPPAWAPTIAMRLATPAAQPIARRATWHYRIAAEAGGAVAVAEEGDRFGRADGIDGAADLLERRITDRVLDYAARAGWLVVAGRLTDTGEGRTLSFARPGDERASTLLRDGEALALPMPLPWSGPLPDRGPLTDVVVAGPTVGPVPTPAALSSILASVRAMPPGGRRVAVRQITAALRGVRAMALPDAEI